MNDLVNGPASERRPVVSIILPTYNRGWLLPSAFEAIRAQTWGDWELIVVDDGSTDHTRKLVVELGAAIPQAVHYTYQENQGAYGARNTGLDLARGSYIAFYDSDDVWLPHHLRDCVRALEANPEVDWVYGACRIVDLTTGAELEPSTFYVRHEPRPFLSLRTRMADRLHIIVDPDANRVMILHGLYCGLQNSVIRKSCFATERFRVHPRHETEDQMVVIRALANGARLGYFDNVHVVYRIHRDNSSAASGGSLDKLAQITSQCILGLEELQREVTLAARERRALQRRLCRECFWHLGYSLLWEAGHRLDAVAMYRRGLRFWPWDPWCWKTYILALARLLGARVLPGAAHGVLANARTASLPDGVGVQREP